jgi:hypothetical protein
MLEINNEAQKLKRTNRNWQQISKQNRNNQSKEVTAWLT